MVAFKDLFPDVKVAGPEWPSYCKVRDVNGTLRTAAWLWEKYGSGVGLFLQAAAPRAFRLIEVRESQGPTVMAVTVRNAQGGPWSGFVADSWPDPTLRSTEGAVSRWEDKALAEMTDVRGVREFGFGPGSVIKGDAGPHTLWVLSPSTASDGIKGIGWLGGTNHHGPLQFVFQLMGEVEPPPIEPPVTSGTYEGEVTLWGRIHVPFKVALDD